MSDTKKAIADGPYATEAEARQAGRHRAADWCGDNEVNCDDDGEY